MGTKLSAELLKTYHGHQGAVYALLGLSNGDIYSAGSDGWLVAWKDDNGQLIAKCPNPVFSIQASTDQSEMLMGTLQGEIHLINLAQKKHKKGIKLSSKSIYAIIAQDQHWHVFSGNGTWWVLNRDLAVEEEIKVSQKALRTAIFTNHSWFIGGSDGQIKKYGNAHSPLGAWESNQPTVMQLAYDAAHKRIISVGRDAALRTYDENGHVLLDPIQAHMGTIHALAVQEEFRWLATGSMDKSFRIWDLDQFQLLKAMDSKKIGQPLLCVNTAVWNKNDLWIAGDDKTIKRFKIESS